MRVTTWMSPENTMLGEISKRASMILRLRGSQISQIYRQKWNGVDRGWGMRSVV